MRSLTLSMLFVFFSPVYSYGQNVAVVGQTNISLSEFKEKYAQVKKQAVNPPSPELFLEDLVRYELGVQEATKRGMKNDPEVQERFKQELYKAFIERELGKKVDAIKVSEKEMRELYKKNPEYRSSHILIKFKPDSTEKEIGVANARAREIYKEVKASKRPFEELVKLYSDDSLSKLNGGDVGYQSRVTVVPTYYDALKKMKIGQISEPIRTLYGFHIVKLTDIRAYKNANKRQLRADVIDQKRKVIFDAFFKQLKSRYKVSKNNSLVKKLK